MPPLTGETPSCPGPWCELGTRAWDRRMGTLFSTAFWDAPGKRLSKAQGGWWGSLLCFGSAGGSWLNTGLRGAACSLFSSGPSSHSITSFLPSRFSSSTAAAVSYPSSCFIALAILTTQLTIYPDGAALVSCAWHVFSIYKSRVRAEATNPNQLCEVSGAFPLATFSIPRSQLISSPF